ncbi:MAG: hypothetical protein RR623_08625 [Bacilli bacterium]
MCNLDPLEQTKKSLKDSVESMLITLIMPDIEQYMSLDDSFVSVEDIIIDGKKYIAKKEQSKNERLK